jgi:hypothetical protein
MNTINAEFNAYSNIAKPPTPITGKGILSEPNANTSGLSHTRNSSYGMSLRYSTYTDITTPMGEGS